MQITINLNELNAEQLGYLESIIRVHKEIYIGYENGDKVCGATEPVETAPEQPQTEDKPKRGRKPKEETVTEQTETASDDVETTKELPTQPETPVEPSTPSSVTLSDVKNKAQTLVQTVNRDAVKSAINKYAEKLSDVKESDFEALMQDFAALEASK